MPQGNVGRCAITTQNPDTGQVDLDTLKALAAYRGEVETTEPLPLGIHAAVAEPGPRPPRRPGPSPLTPAKDPPFGGLPRGPRGVYRWGIVGYSGEQWTMLLGEHEHSLDDKNRLTLPAKLRAAFEDGVVVTRGLDGCLFAYPRDEWEGLGDPRCAASTRSAEATRRMQRHFFAGAATGRARPAGAARAARRRCSSTRGSGAR